MSDFWRGRNVFLTGHTGFKGGWLALYLWSLGAKVHGFGRARTAGPSFYTLANIRDKLASETRADLHDLPALRQAITQAKPAVVLHLAARAIVKEALDDPARTITSNVTSSTNVLEAVRGLDYSPAVVVVTTDKVYRNTGQDIAYPEDAQLGGLDPYGASKSCVELIADCYRHTYRLNVVTARCANVIGGGDWGAYRLVPQCIEAFTAGRPVVAHDATRVWMHVLDACRGYAMLAELMVTGKCRETDPEWCDWEATYNFGPNNPTPVIKVALKVAGAWGNASVETSGCEPSRESAYLDIDSLRAWVDLGWTPRWSLDHTIRRTVEWHRAHLDGADMELVSTEQLNEYKRDVVRLAA